MKKKLSRLSQECIANRGLCCETRTPLVMSRQEAAEIFGDVSEPEFTITQHSVQHRHGTCRFFKEPYCTIQDAKPIDCRTYPVSPGMHHGKKIYWIDRKCPGVAKKLVTRSFIKRAIKDWEAHPQSESLMQDFDSAIVNCDKLHDWVPVEEYLGL